MIPAINLSLFALVRLSGTCLGGAGSTFLYISPSRFWKPGSVGTLFCLGLGGEKSFGKTMAEIMRFAATNVQDSVLPDSGHWIREENPTATISMVGTFLQADLILLQILRSQTGTEQTSDLRSQR